MIFITGGTGLTGSHVLYNLTSAGKRVVALKRPNSSTESVKHVFAYYTSSPNALMERITWVEGDLEDYFSIWHAMKGAAWVYHCAGMVSFNDRDADDLFARNVLGTEYVINAALEHSVSKLAYISSVASLATGTDAYPVNEAPVAKASDFDNRSYYAKTKFLAETEVWRGISEGLNAVIVNPSIILGPGFWQRGSGQFFPMVYKGMRYYSSGITGFVDARDVAAALVTLLESGINNERFVLNAANFSYQKLMEQIAQDLGVKAPDKLAKPAMTGMLWRLEAVRSRLTGKPPLITRHSARSAQTETYYTSAKIKEQLQFSFYPPEKTIRDIAHYFLQDIKK